MAVTHTEPVQSPEFQLATQLMAAREFILDLNLFKKDLYLSVAYNPRASSSRVYSPITMIIAKDNFLVGEEKLTEKAYDRLFTLIGHIDTERLDKGPLSC